MTADYITTRYPVHGAPTPAEAYAAAASEDRLARAEEFERRRREPGIVATAWREGVRLL